MDQKKAVTNRQQLTKTKKVKMDLEDLASEQLKKVKLPPRITNTKSVREILKDQLTRENALDELSEEKDVMGKHDEDSDEHSQDGSQESEKMEDLLTEADKIVQEMEMEKNSQ